MSVPDRRPPTADPPTVFFVAGEISGDMQAALLAAQLHHLVPDLTLVGVGGPRMAAAGVTVLGESAHWGVIGHLDPLLRLRTYLKRLRHVEQLIRVRRPQLLVFVDFPGFNLRLAEQLRGLIPIVYYFPPMVSVRRGNRAQKVARLGMRLLATLPREADAYRAAGADVVYIGNPAVDLVTPSRDPAVTRVQLGIPASAPVVGLLPGSRIQEIRAHLPVMLEAARLLHTEYPDVRFVLPLASPHLQVLVEPAIAVSGLPVCTTRDPYDAMVVATVIATATGTATLEAAVLGTPMVAVYRLPWLSWAVARRIASVRYASLPNILAGRPVVPELLQGSLTADALAGAIHDLLAAPDRRDAMRRSLQQIAAGLGPPGAVGRAAHEVLARLGEKKSIGSIGSVESIGSPAQRPLDSRDTIDSTDTIDL